MLMVFIRMVWSRKHSPLAICWHNVAPPSATLAQHWVNIGPTKCAACGALINLSVSTPNIINIILWQDQLISTAISRPVKAAGSFCFTEPQYLYCGGPHSCERWPRCASVGAHNVYTATHNDPPTLKSSYNHNSSENTQCYFNADSLYATLVQH